MPLDPTVSTLFMLELVMLGAWATLAGGMLRDASDRVVEWVGRE